MVRKCVPIPQKTYNITKEAENAIEEIEKYFPGFIAFTDCTEYSRSQDLIDKRRHKAYYSLGKKKRHTTVKNQLVVNNHGLYHS